MQTPSKHIENSLGTWYYKGTMKQENKDKLAYAAGIIDGEGCVRIVARKPRFGRSTQHTLLLMVAQKDGRLVDWLFGNFGGIVYLKNKRTDGTDWIYEWRVTEQKAADVLKDVLPFLIVKKEQAELAIRFQTHKKGAGHYGDGRFMKLTEHEIALRDKMANEISFLKRAFRKAKNPNVVEYTFKSMVQE